MDWHRRMEYPYHNGERKCPGTGAGWPIEAGVYGGKGTIFPTNHSLRKRCLHECGPLLSPISYGVRWRLPPAIQSKSRSLVVKSLWAKRQGSRSQTWWHIGIIWRASKNTNAFVSPTGFRFTWLGCGRGIRGF